MSDHNGRSTTGDIDFFDWNTVPYYYDRNFFYAENENGETISGGAGDDYIQGNKGDDILLGGAGDDMLIGNGGNDVLDGGAGNDILSGGEGNTTFIFGYGSGHDYMTAGGGDLNRRKVIRFGDGITSDDIYNTCGVIIYWYSSLHIVIHINGPGIYPLGWFSMAWAVGKRSLQFRIVFHRR